MIRDHRLCDATSACVIRNFYPPRFSRSSTVVVDVAFQFRVPSRRLAGITRMHQLVLDTVSPVAKLAASMQRGPSRFSQRRTLDASTDHTRLSDVSIGTPNPSSDSSLYHHTLRAHVVAQFPCEFYCQNVVPRCVLTFVYFRPALCFILVYCTTAV